MKKIVSKMMIAIAMLMMCNAQASAQGLLGKLKKATSTVSETLETDTAQITSPKWDAIPNYTVIVANLTDSNGNPILNEDGSQKVRVLFRNEKDSTDYRSSDVVHQQCRELDKIVTRIIAKVGGGAVLGAAGGLLAAKKKDKGKGALIGGVVGAGAGLALSAGDLKKAKAVKKQMKELENILEVYQKNFTREGIPVSASANLSNVDGLDFSKNQISLEESKYKAIRESTAFNDPTATWL